VSRLLDWTGAILSLATGFLVVRCPEWWWLILGAWLVVVILGGGLAHTLLVLARRGKPDA
jgi:hypothetical protein